MNLTDILHDIVNEPQNEDLRKWFGKGKTGSSSGGGWDRYGSDGQKLGKCGGGEKVMHTQHVYQKKKQLN